MLWSQFILLDILKTLKNTCEIVSPSKIIEVCLETFGIIKNFSGLSKSFRTIPKLSRLLRNFPGYLEIFQAIWKLSGPSGKYPGYIETFRAILTLLAIRKLSRLSGNFPDNPENIQTIWKFFKWSRNFPVQFQGSRAKTFRTRKNFPDGNATLPPRFLGLCIHISLVGYDTMGLG